MRNILSRYIRNRINISLAFVAVFILIPFFCFASPAGDTNIGILHQELSKEKWKIVTCGSEELVGENGEAQNIIDGNPETFWITEWENQKPAHPHEVCINLNSDNRISGFIYLPGQSGNPASGLIKDYDFSVSSDGTNFNLATKGTFTGDKLEKIIFFDKSYTCRFIKLRAISEINGSPSAQIAELGVTVEINQKDTVLSERKVKGNISLPVASINNLDKKVIIKIQSEKNNYYTFFIIPQKQNTIQYLLNIPNDDQFIFSYRVDDDSLAKEAFYSAAGMQQYISKASVVKMAPETTELHFKIPDNNYFKNEASEIPSFSVRSAGGKPEMILLGEEYWKDPWIPDLNNSGKKQPLNPENQIDIIILADGYQKHERERFNHDVARWYERFLTLHPFCDMKGIFRVRSFWTPGSDHASPERKSYFHTGINASGADENVSSEMSSALFKVLDSITTNRRMFPGTNRYSHTYLALLVKTDDKGGTASGRPLVILSPDGKKAVSVSLGEDALHEFGHSFTGLSDEYIGVANKAAKPRIFYPYSLLNKDYQVTPNNLSYLAKRDLLPWNHLVPGNEYNHDQNSMIGLLWAGGEGGEFGVWHSEPTCLMNGGHENWDPGKTKRGAWLRTTGRFCFWCEELTAAYVWYLIGMLGDSRDGSELWKNWLKVRPYYYKSSNLLTRMILRNFMYLKAGWAHSLLYIKPVEMVASSLKNPEGVRIKKISNGGYLYEKNNRVCYGRDKSSDDIWLFEGELNGFIRIKNKNTGHYMHLEGKKSYIECSDIHAGAWSSQWLFYQLVENKHAFMNRWTNEIIITGVNDEVIPQMEDPISSKPGQWTIEETKKE